MSESKRSALDPELLRLVEPLDEHNETLLDNVHPPEWTNPQPADRYHMVVVGAGTAGLVTAAGAAGLGARVALVERRLMGGDCLNYGCVPSKGLIRAARAWHEARTAAERFAGPAVRGEGSFAAAMQSMRALRARISRHDSARRFRDLGVDVFIGEGRDVAGDPNDGGEQRFRFRRAVIATGARPVAPPIPGLDEVDYLTNETLFTLTDLPRRLGIIGGGPIGCEMAQTFARFGADVTLFDMASHVLVREDADAAALVQQSLLDDGVGLALEASISRVEASDTGVRVHFERDDDAHVVEVDRLLVAVGRAPNVEGIGLEAAGVDYERSGVQVDDRLRSSNSKIYAVGDVASRFKFTHMADALARIAIQNALFFGRSKASDLVVPWCTYTSPEIAHVGLYAEDAEDRGLEVETSKIQLSEVDRAVLERAEEGFLRLVVLAGSDRIVGATLVAEHAGEMLGELALAVTHGIGLGKIASTIHPYPTQSEVIKKAGDAWRRTKLTPTVKRIFELYFRLFR
ncbi:MAG: mercuric reductase [Thermoanaerobaculia bacterium]|nr:mercuric reductase [Thermoanaerobaculia bacterium]